MGQSISVVADSMRRFIQEQPVSFMLFLLGALLLVLGLSHGVGWLSPDDQLRPVALGLGIAAIVCSVLLSLRRHREGHPDGPAPPPQPPLTESLANLTHTQRKVLDAVEEATAGLDWVIQQKLQPILAIQGSELFYRLEQLRLLGLVERMRFGTKPPTYGYRLSTTYGQFRGRIAVASKVSQTEE